MKKLLFTFLLFAELKASAQNYYDSTITLTLTQRAAIWITKSIVITPETRKQPDVFKPYVGSGNNVDSLFSVTLKAGFVRDGMELLLTRPLLLALSDYYSIILNSPAVPGYTALGTQITTISSGNGAQKLTGAWLLAWYNQRVLDFQSLYNSEKAGVIRLVQ